LEANQKRFFGGSKMAEGTRMKQLESRMEALEMGMLRTQEAMTYGREDISTIREYVREDLAASRESMSRELERRREMMDQYG